MRATCAVAFAGAALRALTESFTDLGAIGLGVLGLGAGVASVSMRARPVLASRLYLGALIAALTLTAQLDSSAARAMSLVAMCVAVVLAGSWEPNRLGAYAWTALSIVSFLLATLSRVQTNVAFAEEAWLLVGVSAGLAALGWRGRTHAERLHAAAFTSEVARAKLVRSNDELRRSMGSTEAALSKLASIVDNLRDGLVAASVDGRVEIANHALAAMLERDFVEPGGTLEDALPDSMRELVARCLAEDAVVSEELATEDGRWMLVTVCPVHLSDELWGSVTLVRDVTLQREIDRMKSDFVSTVSHEMRTPLTSLLGFTKIVRKQLDRNVFDELPEDAAKAHDAASTVRGNLTVMEKEGRRLTKLIDDVLDLSKMESGQMEWELAPHAPGELIAQALDATRAIFADGPVALESDVPDALPDVQVDADRVLQVLINLIGNAAKFTDEGKVTVAAREVDGMVELSIADTGIGIRQAHLATVFDRFQQVGEVLTDRPKGTGLGLPICQEIVNHHGGEIWVESEVGVGSRFAFTLPCSST